MDGKQLYKIKKEKLQVKKEKLQVERERSTSIFRAGIQKLIFSWLFHFVTSLKFNSVLLLPSLFFFEFMLFEILTFGCNNIVDSMKAATDHVDRAYNQSLGDKLMINSMCKLAYG